MEIPKTIYFCNKSLECMKEYSSAWKVLNPDYVLRYYDDSLIEEFFERNYDETHLKLFRFLQDGPIKADFWRTCVLYTYGGVYSDIDNEPLVKISDFLDESVDMLTCSAYMDKMNFNPNLIMCKKGNSIIKKCIDLYVEKYTSGISYKYWEYSIMQIFTEVIKIEGYEREEGIYEVDGNRIQILQEVKGKDHYDAHNVYKGVRIFNNRYKSWDFVNHQFI